MYIRSKAIMYGFTERFFYNVFDSTSLGGFRKIVEPRDCAAFVVGSFYGGYGRWHLVSCWIAW